MGRIRIGRKIGWNWRNHMFKLHNSSYFSSYSDSSHLLGRSPALTTRHRHCSFMNRSHCIWFFAPTLARPMSEKNWFLPAEWPTAFYIQYILWVIQSICFIVNVLINDATWSMKGDCLTHSSYLQSLIRKLNSSPASDEIDGKVYAVVVVDVVFDVDVLVIVPKMVYYELR